MSVYIVKVCSLSLQNLCHCRMSTGQIPSSREDEGEEYSTLQRGATLGGTEPPDWRKHMPGVEGKTYATLNRGNTLPPRSHQAEETLGQTDTITDQEYSTLDRSSTVPRSRAPKIPARNVSGTYSTLDRRTRESKTSGITEDPDEEYSTVHAGGFASAADNSDMYNTLERQQGGIPDGVTLPTLQSTLAKTKEEVETVPGIHQEVVPVKMDNPCSSQQPSSGPGSRYPNENGFKNITEVQLDKVDVQSDQSGSTSSSGANKPVPQPTTVTRVEYVNVPKRLKSRAISKQVSLDQVPKGDEPSQLYHQQRLSLRRTSKSAETPSVRDGSNSTSVI